MYAPRELEDHSQDKSAQVEFIISSRNICNASLASSGDSEGLRNRDLRDSAFQNAHVVWSPSTVALTYRFISIDSSALLLLLLLDQSRARRFVDNSFRAMQFTFQLRAIKKTRG